VVHKYGVETHPRPLHYCTTLVDDRQIKTATRENRSTSRSADTENKTPHRAQTDTTPKTDSQPPSEINVAAFSFERTVAQTAF